MAIEIIAEIGQNYNGDLQLAKDLICAAKEYGADVAKFQLFDAKKLFSKKGNPWFEYNCRNSLDKDDLYFRVKVFDYINNNKSWRASSASFLNSKFKNSIKIKDSKNLNESYQIILEPYKKKWIPSLKNSKLTSGYREITKDYYNDIFRQLCEKNIFG